MTEKPCLNKIKQKNFTLWWLPKAFFPAWLEKDKKYFTWFKLFSKKPMQPFYWVGLGKENHLLSLTEKQIYSTWKEIQNFTFYIASLYNLNSRHLLKTIWISQCCTSFFPFSRGSFRLCKAVSPTCVLQGPTWPAVGHPVTKYSRYDSRCCSEDTLKRSNESSSPPSISGDAEGAKWINC